MYIVYMSYVLYHNYCLIDIKLFKKKLKNRGTFPEMKGTSPPSNQLLGGEGPFI